MSESTQAMPRGGMREGGTLGMGEGGKLGMGEGGTLGMGGTPPP